MGVLSRVLERSGLVTVGITLVREHTEKVNPPRALWVPYPYGRPLGAPDESDLQLRVIRAAFALIDAQSGPVVGEFIDPDASDADLSLPQADDVNSRQAASADAAFEITTLRPYYEQWLVSSIGRTGVGVSGIDHRRFRGAIRFLEAYARGEDADMSERPPEISRAQFLRWVVDDLKAFYFEARMAQRPNDVFQAHYQWFWGETALGHLLRAVRDRLKAAGDASLDQAAFGIAR